MTYYEEDTPIESAENEGMPPETLDDIVEKVFGEQVEDNRSHEQRRNDEAVERHKEMMEMLGGIFIQLSRIYDATMMGLDKSVRENVENYHSQGRLMGDPPVLEKDAWS